MADGRELGWFKCYRKIEDSPVFMKPTLLQTWMKVLCRASYQAEEFPLQTGRGTTMVTLQPGQCIFGRKSWGRELNREPKSVERDIIDLERRGMVKREPQSHFTLLTVANWASYQASENPGTQTEAENPTKHGVSEDEPQESGQAMSRQCPGNVHTKEIQEVKEEEKRARSSDSEEKKPAKVKGKKRQPKFSPGDMATAEWMRDAIFAFNPEANRPDLKAWANHIRLMREQDRRTDERIREVFQWAMDEPFWQSKMTGPKYLRDKFGTLTGQMKTKAPAPTAAPQRDTSTEGIMAAMTASSGIRWETSE